MRRGHQGIGGWRNDNHRHFRPRTGGTPRFRPPRPQSLLDSPRFPPPGNRAYRGPNSYTRSDEHITPDHHERNNYRHQSHHPIHPRMQERHPRPRNMYSYLIPNLRHDDQAQGMPYGRTSNYYDDGLIDHHHVNSHGDIDHRHLGNVPPPHVLNPWAEHVPNIRQVYEDRIHQSHKPDESERHHTELNRKLSTEYTGHRPPSSDYYGSTPNTSIDNNNMSFSRSVDDTVDIIRKRLLNRNEPHLATEDPDLSQNTSEQEVHEHRNQLSVQEPPTKRRIPRQRQNIKSNCDKMKSNIVQELFKMDKDKMHKLMDDPSSSSKFEFAISSLITESQNSLNRHQRSVAEKSLVVTSREDFIHNDNNTIYEDTFMKQMQCLLDPQDTVLLEDIKPLVMAELSKVLQLDNFEPRYDIDEQNVHQMKEFHQIDSLHDDFRYGEFPSEQLHDFDQRIGTNYDDIPVANEMYVEECKDENFEYKDQIIGNDLQCNNSEVLFARRTLRKNDLGDNQSTIERPRMSTDNPVEDGLAAREAPMPLFDSNNSQFSEEEEDTFAELDRQYHVAVDPNFLENLSARTTPNYVLEGDMNIESIKNEFLPVTNDNQEVKFNIIDVKEEVLHSPDYPKENSTPVNTDISSRPDVSTKFDHGDRNNDTRRDTEKSKSSSVIKSSQSNSRKRSIDQRPSHRKEKRKKSDSSSSEVLKTSQHKPEARSRDRHSKPSDKSHDGQRSYYSIFDSRHDNVKEFSKDHKRNNSSRKGYSDKYVRRKESSRKSKDREIHKKRSSSTSSQIILSPKDSSNNSVTPSKSDPKTKLQSIDMFEEQTKKGSVHQAHRKTAPIHLEEKPKPITSPQKVIQTKHASTQVFKRVNNKDTQTIDMKTSKSKICQTDKTKQVTIGVQTPRVFSIKAKSQPTDAFERMKEIDLEIQELLQEKFGLYNNLESRNAVPHSEQSYLSMTVLNVGTMNQQEDQQADTENLDTIPECMVEIKMEPDTILDDFTNIPVEELEEIALETTENINLDDVKSGKRNKRHKALLKDRMNSESPKSASSRRSNKKSKPPNISLIEQIITDDRPLEDIISLDDLEAPPDKHKRKSSKSKPKKKSTKKLKMKRVIDLSSYDLKECSVLLTRIDMIKYCKEVKQGPEDIIQEIYPIENLVVCELQATSPLKGSAIETKVEPTEVIEDTIVNDLQFDMLDVSEDIVIGETCEIKDKDSNEQAVNINDELILDNSQLSADDALGGESGQVENECRMYDYSTDEELRRDSLTVTGNVDAVLAIECIENDFLAACLDGNVYHFSSDGQLLNTMRGSNLAVTCLTIVKEKYGTTVYTGSLDSRIRYYDLDTGLEKGPECNVLSPIQTMDRAWDTVFVGTRTGFVLQFECKNNMLIPVSTVKFSEQAILALRAMKEGPRKVLLVASRSENVTIKDAQTGLLLRTLAGPKMTVYTLLFEDGKVYCGTSSHQIHVFDYASGTHTGCHEGGKGAVCLRASGGLLFAGCYDGCVYVYREGETRPLAQLRGPSLMLLSLAIVGSKIIAGYKDRSLYIWKIPLSILQEMIL